MDGRAEIVQMAAWAEKDLCPACFNEYQDQAFCGVDCSDHMICSSGEILFYLWPTGNFVEDIGNRRDRKTLLYDTEGMAIIPNFELKQYKLCASVFNTTIFFMISYFALWAKQVPKAAFF